MLFDHFLEELDNMKKGLWSLSLDLIFSFLVFEQDGNLIRNLRDDINGKVALRWLHSLETQLFFHLCCIFWGWNRLNDEVEAFKGHLTHIFILLDEFVWEQVQKLFRFGFILSEAFVLVHQGCHIPESSCSNFPASWIICVVKLFILKLFSFFIHAFLQICHHAFRVKIEGFFNKMMEFGGLVAADQVLDFRRVGSQNICEADYWVFDYLGDNLWENVLVFVFFNYVDADFGDMSSPLFHFRVSSLNDMSKSH